jgi:tRNA modification GTPase
LTPPTLAACLTPPGTGAIATLAIRGPQAWQLVSTLFHPISLQSTWPPKHLEAGRFWFGRLGPDNNTADEVVLAIKRTGVAPWLELHCHGGREVVRWLLEILAAHGIQICSWQELDRQTADDQLQAAAAAALAEAPTTRTAAILLDQYHGAWRRAVEAVEAALERHDLNAAARFLEEMARYTPVGQHLVRPWRVAVLGAPNVGKSSLVNALAGFHRSVVAPTPGTTRDVVTTLIAIDGWPIELADTAGWRETADDLEGQGIERARGAAREADLCLWVLDAADVPVWPDAAMGAVRCVINKVDVPAAWDLDRAAGAIHVSARTGAGLEELVRDLSQWLVADPPPPGAAVPFTQDLCDVVEAARRLGRSSPTEEWRRLLARLRATP